MSKYYDVSEDTIEQFYKIFDKKTFPVQVNFLFQGDEKQKKLIDITKVPDKYAYATKKELFVSINEDLLSVFDETSIEILIEQELDKISISGDSGKIKMVKPDLSTFSSLITKYGVQKVAKANQVEDLYHQQKSDGVEEFEF
jgi:hypothetical protein